MGWSREGWPPSQGSRPPENSVAAARGREPGIRRSQKAAGPSPVVKDAHLYRSAVMRCFKKKKKKSVVLFPLKFSRKKK